MQRDMAIGLFFSRSLPRGREVTHFQKDMENLMEEFGMYMDKRCAESAD